MATFALKSFSASSYASFRPTYPRALFDYIFQYHSSPSPSPSSSPSPPSPSSPSPPPSSSPSPRNATTPPPGRWDRAIDLGCGTGQATTELTPFRHVIGVDPSESMVRQARDALSLNLQGQAGAGAGAGQKIEYARAPAEDLAFVQDASVDLLIAAQACHWFDWAKMWPEAARVLRPGGSLAFWIYSEFRLPQHPSLTPLITAYAQGAESLGPHWEQPGRSVLDGHLQAVPCAGDVVPGAFVEGSWRRVYFTGAHYPSLTPSLPPILRKKMTWAELELYLRTWSALHTFEARYPAEGDVAGRFVGVLRERVEGAGAVGEGGEEGVEVEWPLAMIMVKKA